MGMRPTFDVYRGTKTILGYRERKENKLSMMGEHGNKPIYFRGQEKIYPYSLGRPQY